VHLYRLKGFYSLSQLEKRTRLLWRCTEACDQHVDLARKRRRAPLKSPGTS